MEGDPCFSRRLPFKGFVGEAADEEYWRRELNVPFGCEVLECASAGGSRDGRPGSVPSIDRIDILLLGRVVVGNAGKSRLIGDGGGWSRYGGAGANGGGEGGRMWRLPKGMTAGGGGGREDWAAVGENKHISITFMDASAVDASKLISACRSPG